MTANWVLYFNSIYDPVCVEARLFRSDRLGSGVVEVPIEYVPGSFPAQWFHRTSEWEERPNQFWDFVCQLKFTDGRIEENCQPVNT